MSETLNNEKYEYAGFLSRLAATIIDTLIIFVVVGILYGVAVTFIPSLSAEAALGEEGGTAHDGITFFMDITFVLLVAFFWARFGATPGKMLMNIKVIDAKHGGNIGFGKALLRYLAYIPSTIVFLLGFIWVAFDKEKRGWHDMLVGTRVIKNTK
jgi:uncharacterized RDD family membrane protein YckC